MPTKILPPERIRLAERAPTPWEEHDRMRRHREDAQRVQGEHDRLQFAGAAKHPQELQVVEFAQ